MSKRSFAKLMLSCVALPAAVAMSLSGPAQAQNPSEVKVGLLVPLSGIYARPGAVMRMGAEKCTYMRNRFMGTLSVAG